MQYDNSNRGAIFKNDDKQQDNHPDYKGSLNVNGVDLWVSGWLKTSEKTGKKFLSLSVKPKEDKTSKPAPKPKQNDFNGSDDSDLTF
jgi:uncharacterized protein (DUF736 family)